MTFFCGDIIGERISDAKAGDLDRARCLYGLEIVDGKVSNQG